MFVVVTRLAYERPHSFAPPEVDGLINLNHVLRVLPVETRHSEPCVRIWFSRNEWWDCVGTIDDFWRPQEREAS